jgi:SWI/SNF-related matrix-associated actin-dependent regulator of chromatin subfamily B member 1
MMGGEPGLPVPPQTPRQASQPPVGSPFPPGGLMGMPSSAERKVGGAGVLANAPPLSRVPTSENLGSGPATALSATTGGNMPAAPTGAPQIIAQLPPLPANVNLNPKVTRVSVVPLIDSETTIPALKEDEIAKVKEWMKADREYEGRYKKMRERMTEEMRDNIVKRRAWYEKDPLEDPRSVRRRKEKFDLIGMKSGKDERLRKKAGRREGFKL